MRKLIIAGTHAQYRDWLVLHNANPRAAVEIKQAADLRNFEPTEDEIVLADGHMDNPAFMSPEYLWFLNDDTLSLAS